ncbi:BrnT family toxin [Methylobacterium sp. 77]|uniref:BrnT family toxin n=1 Tax=Methylobacterium sp. 77 TaxID=1101192 RepID=UPI000367D620|nr:BrnT family toxin [Methylobacterium sp. 77]
MTIIVWDESKRFTNLAKHGLDFADFEEAFDFSTAVEVAAEPSATGRTRFRLVGILADRLVVAAIMSPLLTEALSLISLRPASRAERRLYAED